MGPNVRRMPTFGPRGMRGKYIIVCLLFVVLTGCGSQRHVNGAVSSRDMFKDCARPWLCSTYYTFSLQGDTTEYFTNGDGGSDWPHVGDRVTFGCTMYDGGVCSGITQYKNEGSKR